VIRSDRRPVLANGHITYPAVNIRLKRASESQAFASNESRIYQGGPRRSITPLGSESFRIG
jgi:hypothetical protein